MKKSTIIILLFAGSILLSIASYYLMQGYLMKQNGIKTKGVVREMEINSQAGGVTNVLYKIGCIHNDSIYNIDFRSGESSFKIGDSIAFYFNPKETDEIIYPIDNHFRRGNYAGLVIGIVLLIGALIVYRF